MVGEENSVFLVNKFHVLSPLLWSLFSKIKSNFLYHLIQSHKIRFYDKSFQWCSMEKKYRSFQNPCPLRFSVRMRFSTISAFALLFFVSPPSWEWRKKQSKQLNTNQPEKLSILHLIIRMDTNFPLNHNL